MVKAMKRKPTEDVHVRLDPDVKKSVEELAGEYGLSVAAFIRVAVRDQLRKLGREVPAPPEGDADNLRGGEDV
jgi:hypothetical protein